ncbi:uncharacterized protein E0L32_002757 [Thyridium curvatum]|uniref:AB hydrolase-1 domain-containing protein n=1 Tax=Thyridium curvatum TaxID=1093900 RepID=A0A507BN80_9PEZI|nr:uncharacterized protein E0L32_002757 [Thyridium curvatum]TPX18248.1 hypothetical protein E0L32_002757 [Thyridium curvatum]
MYIKRLQEALAPWNEITTSAIELALNSWKKTQDLLGLLPSQIKPDNPTTKMNANSPIPPAEMHPSDVEEISTCQRGKLVLTGEIRSKEERAPILVYLVGGPGSENEADRMGRFTQNALNARYRVLFLNYRGTGTSEGMAGLKRVPSNMKAKYLELFRQDLIVQDLEAIRQCFDVDKWTLWGQSFGGWIALTYLSFYPESLKKVYLTGGMAPIGKSPDEVYQATYNKVRGYNLRYFEAYPRDELVLRCLISEICSTRGGCVRLPNGGRLTVGRLMGLGRVLGSKDGPSKLHDMLHRIHREIQSPNGLSRATGEEIENWIKYDTRPLYAVLHEAIYCDGRGIVSNWAADRIGRRQLEYRWLEPGFVKQAANGQNLDSPLYFSGEMVHPFLFNDYCRLRGLGQVAEELAKKSDWGPLYNQRQLKANTVPVRAAIYEFDMFVDYEISREVADNIGNIKVITPRGVYHDAIREHTDNIMAALFSLK